MDLNFSDPQQWPTEELEQFITVASAEVKRRRVIETAEKNAENIAIEYSEAIGRAPGDEWIQPTGAHNAYPENSQATHNGKLWLSLTPSNVWEPGTSGWREVSVEGGVPEWIQPTGAHDAYRIGAEARYDGEVYVNTTEYNTMSPVSGGWELKYPKIMEWVQPTGAHDAYRLDSIVSYNGKTYKTVKDWNVWIPGEFGWEEVEVPSESTPDAPPVEPEPVPEPEPTVAEFVQPTGAHDSYSIGDRVLFDGVVFESTIDNNSYSPSAYPAGWKSV